MERYVTAVCAAADGLPQSTAELWLGNWLEATVGKRGGGGAERAADMLATLVRCQHEIGRTVHDSGSL
jgi:hypothetical protein